jgi:competence protein ComEC
MPVDGGELAAMTRRGRPFRPLPPFRWIPLSLAGLVAVAPCSPAGDPAPPTEPGLRAAPSSTLRTVDDAVLTLRLLDLGSEAEGGGGDALLVADSSGSRAWHALLDAGDGPRALQALEAAGVDTLDLLLVTHAHFDHYGGAEAVLDRLVVRRIVHNGQVRSASTWAAFLDAVESEPDAEAIVPGETLEVGPEGGGLTLRVLPPLGTFLGVATDDGEALNEGSLAVRVELGAFSLLVTGDAELLANQRFARDFGSWVDVEVLKVGHHGSADATQLAWLGAVTPALALVSANGTTHPHGRTLELLESVVGDELFCTSQHGDLVLRVARDGRYQVRTAGNARERCRVGRLAY